MKKLYNYLRSPRLTIYVMLIIVIVYFLGMLVPQKHLYPEKDYLKWLAEQGSWGTILDQIGLTSFYSTWWFGALIAVLFVNTLFCSIHQFYVSRDKFSQHLGEDNFKGHSYLVFDANRTPVEYIQAVKELLRTKGYKLQELEDGFRARRFSFAHFGSFVFHLSIMTVILGGLVSHLFSVEGTVHITEGQAFSGEQAMYRTLEKGPFATTEDKAFVIGVDGLDINYPDFDSWPIEYSASVVELDVQGQVLRKTKVATNYNLELPPYTLYLYRFGYSPALVIDKDGTNVFGAYAALETIREEDDEKYSGTINLDNEEITIEFYPSPEDYPNPFRPDAPSLVIKGLGTELVLEKGAQGQLGPYTIQFPEYRRWAGFLVSKDPGYPVFVAGSVLGSISMLVWFLIIPKEIYLVNTKNGEDFEILLVGKATKYKEQFTEEFMAIAEPLLTSCRLEGDD